MEFSAYVRQHPKPVIGIVAGVLIVAGLITAYRLGDDRPRAVTGAFFTVDDGKTLFVGSKDLIPPFDHDGKAAVRAQVFTTDGGKTRLVGYLERFTPKAVAKLKAADAGRAAGRAEPLTMDSEDTYLHGLEVKRPGDTNWVAPEDMATRMKVTTVSVPPGGVLDSILP